ncbi:FISUMP domain-containing protein [Fibrobacter succinogenes]|uniref:FISUMP domain-containing protein n=1 Tax=Fibrobacter succinogenes TaxID=833 RepID=UPI0013D2318B|nr:FISUMP domain-containing protein [Fibrobacter succinogenes]
MKKLAFFTFSLAATFYLAACEGTGSSGADELFDEDSSIFSCSSESDSSEDSSKSSSSKGSSSSQKGDDSISSKNSSSSNKAESSSSLWSSSSIYLYSSSVSLSSSSQKVVSSSSATSSSSEYVEKCFTEDAWEFLNPTLPYGEITDKRDGQKYKTIRIGNQTWMAQNLNYYQNSDKTGVVDSSAQAVFDKCGAVGRHYQWQAAMKLTDCDNPENCPDSIEHRQGICPEGFHIPTRKEYQELFDYTGITDSASFFSSIAARVSLKECYCGWDLQNVIGGAYNDIYSAHNTSGFSLTRGEYLYSQSSRLYPSNPSSYRAGLMTADGNMILFDSEKKIDIAYNKASDYFINVRCIEDAENPSPAPEPIVFPKSQYSGTYGTLIDERDGQSYKTVKIGDKVWMAENLNYESPQSACYAYKEENCKKYGRLYFWYDAVGKTYNECRGGGAGSDRNYCQSLKAPIQGICPSGWHMPDTFEIQALVKQFIIDSSMYIEDLSRYMRAPTEWLVTSDYGTDIYGFHAIPGGSKEQYGPFKGLNAIAKYWSMNGALMPAALVISFSSVQITNSNLFASMVSEWYWGGMESVRCVMDDSPSE